MIGGVQARSLREKSTGCCARTRSCRAFATQTPDPLWGIARCLFPLGGLPGTLVRLQGYLETKFEPGRRFANERDYQHQLDAWFAKANARTHKTQGTPARPPQDRAGGWRSCRCSRISTGAGRRESRSTYVRYDTNDYSPGPRLASRRVEVRVSQTNLTAICSTPASWPPATRGRSLATAPSPRSSTPRAVRVRRGEPVELVIETPPVAL